MAQPTDRTSFIAYCKGKLGFPVIQVELTDPQADSCVDDALTKWREYHYDATHRTYYQHQVTSDDITNGWIPCPDNITSVVRIVSCTADNLSIFDVRYQLRLQDFYNFSNVSMQHYVITMEKLALIDWLLNPEATMSFERFTDRIYLNVDWTHRVNVGDFLVIEVYEWLDEVTYPRIWTDKWLKDYSTALMRRQWGSNVKKYSGTQTTGSVIFNGQQIFDEATGEIEQLEEQLYRDYQAPCRIFIG